MSSKIFPSDVIDKMQAILSDHAQQHMGNKDFKINLTIATAEINEGEETHKDYVAKNFIVKKITSDPKPENIGAPEPEKTDSSLPHSDAYIASAASPASDPSHTVIVIQPDQRLPKQEPTLPAELHTGPNDAATHNLLKNTNLAKPLDHTSHRTSPMDTPAKTSQNEQQTPPIDNETAEAPLDLSKTNNQQEISPGDWSSQQTGQQLKKLTEAYEELKLPSENLAAMTAMWNTARAPLLIPFQDHQVIVNGQQKSVNGHINPFNSKAPTKGKKNRKSAKPRHLNGANNLMANETSACATSMGAASPSSNPWAHNAEHITSISTAFQRTHQGGYPVHSSPSSGMPISPTEGMGHFLSPYPPMPNSPTGGIGPLYPLFPTAHLGGNSSSEQLNNRISSPVESDDLPQNGLKRTYPAAAGSPDQLPDAALHGAGQNIQIDNGDLQPGELGYRNIDVDGYLCIMQMYPKKSTDPETPSVLKKCYLCKEQGCNYDTDRKYNLKRHCLTHNVNGRLPCPHAQCAKTFVDSYILRDHFHAAHPNDVLPDSIPPKRSKRESGEKRRSSVGGVSRPGTPAPGSKSRRSSMGGKSRPGTPAPGSKSRRSSMGGESRPGTPAPGSKSGKKQGSSGKQSWHTIKSTEERNADSKLSAQRSLIFKNELMDGLNGLIDNRELNNNNIQKGLMPQEEVVPEYVAFPQPKLSYKLSFEFHKNLSSKPQDKPNEMDQQIVFPEMIQQNNTEEEDMSVSPDVPVKQNVSGSEPPTKSKKARKGLADLFPVTYPSSSSAVFPERELVPVELSKEEVKPSQED